MIRSQVCHAPTTFAWASIAQSGATLAFGTDWPVSQLSPLNALHSALSRQPWAADAPDQRLTLQDCLTAYSTGGAHAMFAEDRRGKLSVGQEADMILIDGPLNALARDPAAARVSLTVSRGRILYRN